MKQIIQQQQLDGVLVVQAHCPLVYNDLSQVLTADTNVSAGRTIAVSCRLTNDFGFVVETVNFTVNNVAPEITGFSGVPTSITLSGRFYTCSFCY